MSEPLSQSQIKMASTEGLSALVDETETLLGELKSELKRREEAAQHREIDALDEHMANARINLGKVREFFEMMLQELRGNR